jgi:hypothetical protein
VFTLSLVDLVPATSGAWVFGATPHSSDFFAVSPAVGADTDFWLYQAIVRIRFELEGEQCYLTPGLSRPGSVPEVFRSNASELGVSQYYVGLRLSGPPRRDVRTDWYVYQAEQI